MLSENFYYTCDIIINDNEIIVGDVLCITDTMDDLNDIAQKIAKIAIVS